MKNTPNIPKLYSDYSKLCWTKLRLERGEQLPQEEVDHFVEKFLPVIPFGFGSADAGFLAVYKISQQHSQVDSQEILDKVIARASGWGKYSHEMIYLRELVEYLIDTKADRKSIDQFYEILQQHYSAEYLYPLTLKWRPKDADRIFNEAIDGYLSYNQFYSAIHFAENHRPEQVNSVYERCLEKIEICEDAGIYAASFAHEKDYYVINYLIDFARHLNRKGDTVARDKIANIILRHADRLYSFNARYSALEDISIMWRDRPEGQIIHDNLVKEYQARIADEKARYGEGRSWLDATHRLLEKWADPAEIRTYYNEYGWKRALLDFDYKNLPSGDPKREELYQELLALQEKDAIHGNHDCWVLANNHGDIPTAIKYLRRGKSYLSLVKYATGGYRDDPQYHNKYDYSAYFTSESIKDLIQDGIDYYLSVAKPEPDPEKRWACGNTAFNFCYAASLEIDRKNYLAAALLYERGCFLDRAAEVAVKRNLPQIHYFAEQAVRHDYLQFTSYIKHSNPALYQQALRKIEEQLEKLEHEWSEGQGASFERAAEVAGFIDDAERVAIYRETSRYFEEVMVP